MTADLVAFLRARLDEDQQRAKRGYYSDTHWELFTTTAHLKAWAAWRGYYPREQWDVKANDAIADAARDGIRERITAHEADRTARALREIEAHRRILDETWGGPDHEDMWLHHVRLLALPYADHEDYQPEWAPTPA